MFRHASVIFIAVALTGVALLSLLADDGGPVALGELGEHAGETVLVEGTVVALDGDRTLLWDDGATVYAYGENPFGHGDRVRARGYVSTGRSVYLNVDSYSLVRAARPVTVLEASSGSWVECSGVLVVEGTSVFLNTGPMEVPLGFHIDIDPVAGVELTLEGVFHKGAVQVYDRSCIGSDDVLASPWISVGMVTLQGAVALEPSGTSLSLATIDGTIRAVCNTTGVHMLDIVEVTGMIEYDPAYSRFILRGECALIGSNGPVAVTPEELFTYPWMYEDATVSILGNVTELAGGDLLVTAAGSIAVTGGPLPGMQLLTGRLVLGDDLRYVIDAG